MARDDRSIGDKLLPKIIHAVSQTIITTRRSLLPWDHYVRVKATQDIIDKAGLEIAEHYGPFVDKILEIEDGRLSPELRQFLVDSRSGEHQLKAVTGLVMGPVSSAIGLLISNELAPLVYQLVGSNPHLVFDAQTAANAAAQRVESVADAELDMAKQGYGGARQGQLIELAYSYPAIADALELYRRGLINQAALVKTMERNAVPAEFILPFTALANNELSLADAALAYLRSDITLQEAQAIAASNGYSNSQLDIFIGNTGEPLGLEQLLEANRRGFIDQARLDKGIRQSRVRNEWIDVANKLAYSPISVADAVNAAVQNHLSQADADKISQQNGLEPGSFPILYETAGEPLSRTELEQLYNRGLIPESEVKQGLAESRLKNKYIDSAFLLHERLLEPRQLAAAVTAGAVTHAEAVKLAMEYGLSAASAEILIGEGSARKLESYRNRIVASAETLYEEEAITAEEFTAIALSMGFDSSEAKLVLQAAEYRRQSKTVTGVIGAVRSRYVAHHLTRNDASGFLDAIGIKTAQRDYLLTLWDIESAANVRNLTPAQIVKAVKLSLITPEDGLARLVREGYSSDDATLLLKGA